MQIRLTVVDPLGPPSPTARGRAASRDVLVTAPAGTALAAVASALAAAVAGETGAAERAGRERGAGAAGREPGAGPVVLYAGAERLDAQRCTLGEPPLLDGAVLSLGAPAQPEAHPELDEAPAQLHVIAGPDAGGVHLLHGGQITVGRSADADVPLDDPDVSRVHCAVTVAPDGRVSVADLGSTNGTALDDRPVDRPVGLAPGALLRIGESVLRLTPSAGPAARRETAPDGEGHARVAGPAPTDAPTGGHHPGTGSWGRTEAEALRRPGAEAEAPRDAGPGAAAGSVPGAATVAGTGTAGWSPGQAPGAAAPRTWERGPVDAPAVPAQGRAPRIESRGGDTHAGRGGVAGYPGAAPGPDGSFDGGGRKGTPVRGTDVPQGLRRRGGLGAWARRLAGGRGEAAARGEAYDDPAANTPDGTAPGPWATPRSPETWPDPAALLLTALGPGPRLWERGPGHSEALTVRLGTADRPAPDGSGRLLPAVPVTADLREVGALGLAGPRARLAGLARAVLAQLAALHSPDVLEIVLLSTDRARPAQERTAEWSWLGWLPHLRPGHGQDCRLLLAYDREQAAARTDELLRRLEDHLADSRTPAPAAIRADHPEGGAPDAGGDGPAAPYPAEAGPAPAPAAAHRPSWAREETASGPAGGFAGPYTVVVVDGDPGGAAVRDAVARLAQEGPRAGIHVICLAEAAAAAPAVPQPHRGTYERPYEEPYEASHAEQPHHGVHGEPSRGAYEEAYEAACAASPVFRECGAVALLGGDVATALRLMRVARSGGRARRPVAPGTVAVVDAVSPAWAERFARALAPLRSAETAAGNRPARVSAPLPLSARLLDELGLARATPASLQARWADAADDASALGGRAWAILGAGPRGPVCADLVADGPHLLVEGPAGSGRTELLRSVVASLAAAERPDRLGIVLVDGRDGTGTAGGPGEGLRVCTDVPHVTTHLTANDPVRMREFAQSLSAELKRRAELLGLADFAEWHGRRGLSGRIVAQRSGPPGTGGGPAAGAGADDLDTPPSSTLRLRPAAARARTEAAPPLPRLVVVVDDLDALVCPALGSPGRPAAGSVIRALEAVARDGERLGVHLVAATAPGGRTAQTEPVRRAALRVELDPPESGPGAAGPLELPGGTGGRPAPGRGRLTAADGRVTPFQGGRVTGRIPRTATQRPTVVPLEWQRMGDPPTRRPVRELGNGPTDLALLASALERAAREVAAARVPSLI
ncbi:FHA domain-containing protein [Streptomyces sp. NPDC006743]|uniref:FHA domain-containing protein n=1 Tax=Streptomyces sp. NPDC006743 TaxID=3154480 RepID=UPI0034535241